MKLVVVGATGNIGKQIIEEALTRGHEVTAIVRDASRVETAHEHLHVVTGDIFNVDSIAKEAANHDVLISAFGPKHGEDEKLVEATHSLLQAAKQAGVSRLVAVGGAGSLEVAPGLQVVDTPAFPAEWKSIAFAHRDALEVYKQSDFNWTNLSPAAMIEPGERTGKYVTGTDQLLTDENGDSRITIPNYAVALLDEVENPQFPRQRFTVRNA
ncbi:NAD(P)-dependent oxidoreductase [Bacillus sp. CGMCC 1.60114]|uniref:NAD(P)-dependent oxidoreductase n=1 Tax=unclassified Bacillus (in: firmicutes) TaxID=185979 RepID=UPI0036285B90